MNHHPMLFGVLLCLLALAACDTPNATFEVKDTDTNIHWMSLATIATGQAHTGPWRMNDSEFHYIDDASVSLGDDGLARVVWVDNKKQDIFFQLFDADNTPQIKSPVNVSRSPGTFSWLPKILSTHDHKVYVLWEEIVFSGGSHGGEIFFSRSEDGGNNFSTPINLSNTTAGAGKGRLTEHRWDNGSFDFALGSNGEIFVVWTEYEGALHFRQSTDGGHSFSDIKHISGNQEQPARAPSLAAAPNSHLYLAWSVGEDPSADIHIAISRDGGKSFGPEQIPINTDGHSDVPSLAVSDDGKVHLVHAESPDGPFTPAHIRYLTLDNQGQAQNQPRPLSPKKNTTNPAARAPSVALDGKGGLYVLWEHQPDPEQRARGLGFSYSRDNGQYFSEPSIIPGSKSDQGAVNGSLQGQLARKLSVNRQGAIAVVNSHFLEGEWSRVLLIRAK